MCCLCAVSQHAVVPTFVWPLRPRASAVWPPDHGVVRVHCPTDSHVTGFEAAVRPLISCTQGYDLSNRQVPAYRLLISAGNFSSSTAAWAPCERKRVGLGCPHRRSRIKNPPRAPRCSSMLPLVSKHMAPSSPSSRGSRVGHHCRHHRHGPGSNTTTLAPTMTAQRQGF